MCGKGCITNTSLLVYLKILRQFWQITILWRIRECKYSLAERLVMGLVFGYLILVTLKVLFLNSAYMYFNHLCIECSFFIYLLFWHKLFICSTELMLGVLFVFFFSFEMKMFIESKTFSSAFPPDKY